MYDLYLNKKESSGDFIFFLRKPDNASSRSSQRETLRCPDALACNERVLGDAPRPHEFHDAPFGTRHTRPPPGLKPSGGTAGAPGPIQGGPAPNGAHRPTQPGAWDHGNPAAWCRRARPTHFPPVPAVGARGVGKADAVPAFFIFFIFYLF